MRATGVSAIVGPARRAAGATGLDVRGPLRANRSWRLPPSMTDHESPAEPPAPNDPPNDSLLSGGGIAGIVIGTILGVFLIAAVAFFFVKRNSHRRNTSSNIWSDK